MSYLTPDDERAYGPELLDVMRRGARDAISPELAEIRRRQAEIAMREQRLENQTVFSALDAAIPEWRSINTSDAFKTWLSAAHPYSGKPIHQHLLEGFYSADAPRVVTIFRNYLAEAGMQTPGRPHHVSNDQGARPSGSREALIKQMTKLLQEKTRGAWRGREKEAEKLEADLHRAIHSQQR